MGKLILVLYAKVVKELIFYRVIMASSGSLRNIMHRFIWTELLGCRIKPRRITLKIGRVFVRTKIYLKIELIPIATLLDQVMDLI
jgi:hypothetical protein